MTGMDRKAGCRPLSAVDTHQDEIGPLFCHRCERVLAILGLGDFVVVRASISRMIWRSSS
jgi:hypothetical protein